jgi:hypothetical protein
MQKECDRCYRLIPEDSRSDKKYCSVKCRRKAEMYSKKPKICKGESCYTVVSKRSKTGYCQRCASSKWMKYMHKEGSKARKRAKEKREARRKELHRR